MVLFFHQLSPHPQFPVEAPVVYRLGDMRLLDHVFPVKIGDGPGDFVDPVERAGRKPHFVNGGLEERHGARVEFAVGLQVL